MLEILTVAETGRYWDGVPPPQDANTLFRMHTFSTLADVVDKGPNSVPVTRNGTFVVSNDPAYGPKVRMTAANFLSWASTLLNAQSFDVTMILGNYAVPASSPVLFDGRPNNTNGNYVAVSIFRASPTYTSFYHNQVQAPASTTFVIGADPVVMTFKFRPNVQEAWVNGKLVLSWPGSFSYASNQNYKLGRNAYAASANIPNLQADLYYFDIKKVP